MAKLSRRGLLKKATIGAGVASLLATAAASEAFASPVSTQKEEPVINATGEPLVVWVTDPALGTLLVMQGKRSVTVKNPGLVRSLLSLS
jgi:hypothetical protein